MQLKIKSGFDKWALRLRECILRRINAEEKACLTAVTWALYGAPASFDDMCMDHRSIDVTMPQQFLHGSNIVAVLQQVRREGMAERMAACLLGDAGITDGDIDSAIQSRRMCMVSSLFCVKSNIAVSIGWKQILPVPVQW